MKTYLVPQPLGYCDKPAEMKKKKVLVLTEKEWKDLNERKDWIKNEEEKKEKLRQDKLWYKYESRNMVKNWRNTLEDTRVKKLKQRQERLDKEAKERDLKFLQIEKENAEERRKYLERCKRLLCYEKDSTKTLNSALRFAEVLREREAQKRFERKLKDMEDQREAEYAAKVKKDAEDWAKEQVENRRKAEKKMKKMKYIFHKQRG